MVCSGHGKRSFTHSKRPEDIETLLLRQNQTPCLRIPCLPELCLPPTSSLSPGWVVSQPYWSSRSSTPLLLQLWVKQRWSSFPTHKQALKPHKERRAFLVLPGLSCSQVLAHYLRSLWVAWHGIPAPFVLLFPLCPALEGGTLPTTLQDLLPAHLHRDHGSHTAWGDGSV